MTDTVIASCQEGIFVPILCALRYVGSFHVIIHELQECNCYCGG